jgi:hypothetical protein
MLQVLKGVLDGRTASTLGFTELSVWNANLYKRQVGLLQIRKCGCAQTGRRCWEDAVAAGCAAVKCTATAGCLMSCRVICMQAGSDF